MAFDQTKEHLGAEPTADWLRGYYQAANRISTIYSLQREGVPAHLLFIYFLGDNVEGRDCPTSADQWNPAIKAQWAHLGLSADHRLADRVHELFLPIKETPP